MNLKISLSMLLMVPDEIWSKIVLKAILIRVNTRGEEDMLVAKSEAGTAENVGVFLRNIPCLYFLNSAS